MRTEQAEPEFSRPVHIDEVSAEEVTFELEAAAAERDALAQRFSLLALERLTATARVRRSGAGGAVRVRVTLLADVVQSCVVTLDPVPAHVEESFELVFAPEAEIPAEAGEIEVAHDDEEPPEPLRGGTFDLGEAVAEHLALALDPYPRRPGVSVLDVLTEGAHDGDEGDETPFAVLRRLKRGR